MASPLCVYFLAKSFKETKKIPPRRLLHVKDDEYKPKVEKLCGDTKGRPISIHMYGIMLSCIKELGNGDPRRHFFARGLVTYLQEKKFIPIDLTNKKEINFRNYVFNSVQEHLSEEDKLKFSTSNQTHNALYSCLVDKVNAECKHENIVRYYTGLVGGKEGEDCSCVIS